MRVHIGYDLRFQVPAATPMLLLLHTIPNRYFMPRLEHLHIEPFTPAAFFYDALGNGCTRLVAPPGVLKLTNDAIVEVDGQPDIVNWNATQHQIQTLPYEAIPFLKASRYCETDRLGEFAWQQFGNGPTGYARAHAVCQFVHNHIQFGYEFARNTKTAYEVFEERQGVCRDFAHLAITLCRCLGIPARYTTGYLGDIGVPFNPAPMDFSAWFEVYLSGVWYTFDARHMEPRIGRIVMAYGYDASNTALTTSFGPTTLQQFTVWTKEITG